MSSWTSSAAPKNLSMDKFYCKTSSSGYCSNFFNFFMCYLFAKSKQKTLYLHDTKNNISKSYHLILDTFQELPGIQYTPLQGLTLQQAYNKELQDYFEHLPQDILTKEAKQIFRLNARTQTKINTLRKPIPSVDVGIHVRTGDKITTGEMIAIPFERYMEELRKYRKTLQKDTFVIYVMTDSANVLTMMNKQKDPDWILVSLPAPYRFPNGHDQQTYNKQSPSVIMESFHHFLAEINIMQTAPHILCTFSSNIGRFLNLTRTGTIFSLD